MRVAAITATSHRPCALDLCRRWMARQTRPVDVWCVVSDSGDPGTIERRPEPGESPRQSMCRNLLAASERSRLGVVDAVVVVEDDDYYAPQHVEEALRRLERAAAVGSDRIVYYHLQGRWREMRNQGVGVLATTAFRAGLLDVFREAVEECARLDQHSVDVRFWSLLRDMGLRLDLGPSTTVVGMKGLPGKPGLGVGHDEASSAWTPDPTGSRLRELVGAEAAPLYMELAG